MNIYLDSDIGSEEKKKILDDLENLTIKGSFDLTISKAPSTPQKYKEKDYIIRIIEKLLMLMELVGLKK